MLGRPEIVRAGVHERVGRIVIDRLGRHRADDADVVRDRADVAGSNSQISWPDLPNFLNSYCGAEALELLALQLRDRLALW